MSDPNFHIAFYGLCIVLLWLAVRGILGGRSIFAYPTLAALMGLAWVVPQGIDLETRAINPYGSEEFWLYVAVCFVSIFVGFRYGYKVKRRQIARSPSRELKHFSDNRLLSAAAGLTALGLLAQFQMRGIDTSAMAGQWTGVITMWALFEKASGFGLCLAVLVFARTRSWISLAIAAVAVAPLAQAAFLGVRREAIFDLLLLTGGAWYFANKSYPPRAAVIAVLLIGTVFLNNVDQIRGRILSGEESFAEVITSAEVFQDFSYVSLDQGVASEVGLAQYDFWYSNENSRWELGAEHWNRLVHQYVPAFVLGREFKESLKFSTLAQRIRAGEEEGLQSRGSTRTGFSDSYRAFGMFGALLFAMISYFFGTLYAASSAKLISSQYLYLVLAAEGLKAITHSTGEFLAALPFTLLLFWVAFGWAKIPKVVAHRSAALRTGLDAREHTGRV